MSNPIVIFTLDGDDLTIQCSQEEKMKDICQRYANKIEANLYSLMFLYGGDKLNLDLAFKEQINSIDKNNNRVKVIVIKNNNNDFICPKCGEKVKINEEKIDDIILSNKNIKDNIYGIKLQIENMIKNSSNNIMNIQLKNINIILNTINEDIQKNNDKLKNLFNHNINKVYKNKNSIKGIINIDSNEINEVIIIYFFS